jgi:hypothetical protein
VWSCAQKCSWVCWFVSCHVPCAVPNLKSILIRSLCRQ